MNDSLKNHHCRFNDFPQICTCFVEGQKATLQECREIMERAKVYGGGARNHVWNSALNEVLQKFKSLKSKEL